MSQKKAEVDLLAEFNQMLSVPAGEQLDAIQSLLLLHRKVKQKEQTPEEFSRYLKLRDQIVRSELETSNSNREVKKKLEELEIELFDRRLVLTQEEVEALLNAVKEG